MSSGRPLTMTTADGGPPSPLGRAQIDRKLAMAQQRRAELEERISERKEELRAALAAEMAVARDELARLDADRDRQLTEIERQADAEIERAESAAQRVIDAHDQESVVEDRNDEL